MVLRKADAQTESGIFPPNTTELFGAMGAYMQEMTDAGILRAGEGLQPSSKGAKVKFRNGKPTVIDGPFTEAKELIAGYSIIEVRSLQEAIDWTKKWPASDAEGNVEIEIRRIYEAEDFGDMFTPEQRVAEEKMRAKAAEASKIAN